MYNKKQFKHKPTIMEDFRTYKGEKLSPDTISYLYNTPLEEIRERAMDLEFKSWCPVVMVNDSEQLRKDMKKASEMLFAFIKHAKSCTE